MLALKGLTSSQVWQGRLQQDSEHSEIAQHGTVSVQSDTRIALAAVGTRLVDVREEHNAFKALLHPPTSMPGILRPTSERWRAIT